MAKKTEPQRLEADANSGLLESRACYQGRLIHVFEDTVQGPTGRPARLEIIKHPGGAAALAIDQDEQICLVKQFRHAAGGWIYEIPAGRRDPGEDPLQTAKRELEEEVGRTASEWHELAHMWSTPGFCDEIISLYLARDLRSCNQQLESDEFIEVLWLPYEEALHWCREGIISDSKTLAALFHYQLIKMI